MYIDLSGHWLVPALVIGGILLATLTSCNSMSDEEYYNDIYLPEGDFYDWGSFNEEDVLELAIRSVYDATYRNDKAVIHEYGAFIYTRMAYNPEAGTDTIRYYATVPYTTWDSQSIKLLPSKVPQDATIIGFVHSHPFPKDKNIFSNNDVKEFDMYVVEECPCVYVLRANEKQYVDNYEILYRNEEYHEKYYR